MLQTKHLLAYPTLIDNLRVLLEGIELQEGTLKQQTEAKGGSYRFAYMLSVASINVIRISVSY